MAGTFVQFTPSTVQAFSFQPTLGGTPYTCTVPWNIFGQRYYIQLSDLGGNLILCRALVSGGPTYPASFTWANGWATALCASPHNVPVGRVVNAYLSQTDTGFDGGYPCLSTGATSLAYQIPNPNESASVAGQVNFSWNLVEGYVDGYLLFNGLTQQFEFG
jgi:hypothetical protein